MIHSQKIRLVVFAKFPQPGRVKTRLAETIGPEKACQLYRAWVPPFIQYLSKHHHKEISIEIALAPPESDSVTEESMLENARNWIPEKVDWGFQSGTGLGERLTRAFEYQFEHGWTQVFAIGTDSPQIPWPSFLRCFNLLKDCDLVLGPTEDGGYYTVGMKKRPGDLFREIRWSSPLTLKDTRLSAQNLGWTVGIGPLEYDLDTIEDLNRLIEERAVDYWPELKAILKEE